MPKKAASKPSALVDKIADFSQRISVNPTDPRFWQSHFQPAVDEGLQLAKAAQAAGLSEHAIGYLIQLATYLGLSEDFERACEAGTLAVDMATALDDRDAYASALIPLACAVGEHESQARAKKLLKEALRIREKLHGRRSLLVADVLYHLGGLARDSIELNDSYDYFERCLAIREALLPPDHFDVAAALDAFGLSHFYLGRAEGIDLVKRALEIRERVLPEDHPWLAESMNNLALFCELCNEDFDKEAMYRRCLEISEKWYGPTHGEVATHAENLGITLQERGAFEEAEALFRRVIEMNEHLHGDSAECLPMHIHSLVDCLCEAGKSDEAVEWIERGVKLLREQEEGSEAKRRWLCQFANRCSELNMEDEAIEIYLEIVDALDEVEDPDFEISILSNLASSYLANEEIDLAVARYDQALNLARIEFGPNGQQAYDILLQELKVFYETEDHAQEVRVARDCLAIAKKLHRKQPTEIALAHFQLAMSLRRAGLKADAEKQLLASLELFEQHLGKEDDQTLAVMESLQDLRNEL